MNPYSKTAKEKAQELADLKSHNSGCVCQVCIKKRNELRSKYKPCACERADCVYCVIKWLILLATI